MKRVAWVVGLGAVLSAGEALAAGGQCTADNGVACQAALSSSANVVDDVFKDKNGKTYDLLPASAVGQLFNNWPTCAYPSPFNYPGWSYGTTFAEVAAKVNAIDGNWAVPVRWLDGSMGFDANTGCPTGTIEYSETLPGGFFPQYGMVFDLGGPSNQVAVFPFYDHGPNPCESAEYTVYLTDDPQASETIEQPTTLGADPKKWNRAKLDRLYLQGKGPQPGASNEWVTVYSLPCGINFRYVSVLAGNDGGDFAACSYYSWDAELDGVMGLTETNEAVCPDADGDKFVDCNCPSAPAVCDCNDADATVHPGAPEVCGSDDKNCDNQPGTCAPDLTCHMGICLRSCTNKENSFCPAGSNCTNTENGLLCVPASCAVDPNACPPGTVCSGDNCVPACDSVNCPAHQICQDGQCIDPCKGIVCPGAQVCEGGKCTPPCNCFAGDIGCAGVTGTVCDKGNTNTCVSPSCVGVMCSAPDICEDTTGTCQPFCNADVACPAGQKCVEPDGCVPLCQGVSCPLQFECDVKTGTCVDTTCLNITCFAPQVCKDGACITPEGTGGAGGGTGGAGGGLPTSAGGAGGDGGAGGADPSEKGKCACDVVGGSAPLGPMEWLAAAGLVALFGRRRRNAV